MCKFRGQVCGGLSALIGQSRTGCAGRARGRSRASIPSAESRDVNRRAWYRWSTTPVPGSRIRFPPHRGHGTHIVGTSLRFLVSAPGTYADPSRSGEPSTGRRKRPDRECESVDRLALTAGAPCPETRPRTISRNSRRLHAGQNGAGRATDAPGRPHLGTRRGERVRLCRLVRNMTAAYELRAGRHCACCARVTRAMPRPCPWPRLGGDAPGACRARCGPAGRNREHRAAGMTVLERLGTRPPRCAAAMDHEVAGSNPAQAPGVSSVNAPTRRLGGWRHADPATRYGKSAPPSRLRPFPAIAKAPRGTRSTSLRRVSSSEPWSNASSSCVSKHVPAIMWCPLPQGSSSYHVLRFSGHRRCRTRPRVLATQLPSGHYGWHVRCITGGQRVVLHLVHRWCSTWFTGGAHKVRSGTICRH
jgi:hypothetical protein